MKAWQDSRTNSGEDAPDFPKLDCRKGKTDSVMRANGSVTLDVSGQNHISLNPSHLSETSLILSHLCLFVNLSFQEW